MAGEMRTWLLLFLFLGMVAVGAGCGGNSSASSSPTPIPTQSNRAGVTVLAYGDDFTVGIGTSTCGTALYGPPCSTSPSNPGIAAASNPQGWSQMLAGYIAATPRWQPSSYVPLGVAGALSGDAPKPEGPGGDLLTNTGQFTELSALATTVRSTNIKMLVVIQAGINDTLDAFYSAQCTGTGGTVVGGGGATYAAPCTASGTTLAPGGNARNGTLYAAYSTMLADLNALAGGAPEATLIVGVPNLGAFPFCIAQFGAGAPQCATLTTDAQNANTAIQDAIADAADKQVAFADWYTFFQTNPSYYSAGYFASDNFHLNNQGYAVLAPFVEQVVLAAVNSGTFNMSREVAAPPSAR